MDSVEKRVCPVEHAGSLDIFFRRWLQNPVKILNGLVRQGMTVMDYGCGPGFFTLDMAQMVGGTGKVIAVDLQKGMLAKLETKLGQSDLKDRIQMHQCPTDGIGLSEKIDFALAFYVLHEIPDQGAYFRELATLVRPQGQVLIVEPPFHVSRAAFQKTLSRAQNAGFTILDGPKVLLSKTAVLRN
jgi:ubiquinone/menaquinone biosynthesis C-methylase UbiE